MDRSDILTLIKVTYRQDEIGQQIPLYTKKEVFCDVTSVSRAEWYDAGRNGFNPDFRFVINRYDYEGETECEFNGTRYGIYRTYFGRTDDLELYVQKKAGIDNGTC
jgi:SPP1 family predicted phage head-tail adaptor